MAVVPHVGYKKYDVRQFAGGQLQINIGSIIHGNYSNVNWTIGVIFLDDNDIPVHNISYSSNRNTNYNNPDNLFNTVILVPHITSDVNTHHTNFSKSIDVPTGARQMIWFFTKSYYDTNNYANIQSGDKLLLTYKGTPDQQTFYGNMFSLKSYISDITGAIVINKDYPLYGADYMLSSSYINHPYTTNDNNERLVKRTFNDGSNNIYLTYATKRTNDHYVELNNIEVLGTEYVNQPPVISIGNNDTIMDGETVYLNGTAIDPEGDAISYLWTCETDPSIVISNNTTTQASATINLGLHHTDNSNDIIFKLIATDALGNVSDPGYITVTVKPPLNNRPITEPKLVFFDIEGGITNTYVDYDTYDPDGDPLTYSWTQISGPELQIQNPNQKDINITFPTLAYGVNNVAVVEGVITDVGGLSVKRTYEFHILNEANQPPYVYAGEDQLVDSLTVVTLTGTINDFENDNVNYSWSQISGPIVNLDVDPQQSKNRIITTPLISTNTGNTDLVFQLLANDGINPPVTDTVTITVKPKPNTPPVPRDNMEFNVIGGETNIYEDTISYDPDDSLNGYDINNDTLSYSWKQISGPTLIISDKTTRNINVTFPILKYGQDNISILEATITDNGGYTATFRYTFTIQTEANQAPIINQKNNLDNETFTITPELKSISRSVSASDPEGLPINYIWTLNSAQVETIDGLIDDWFGTINFDPNAEVLSFVPPELGNLEKTLTLEFQIVVNDGDLSSSPETYIIVLNAPEPEIVDGDIYYDPDTQEVVVDGRINPVTFQDIYDALLEDDITQTWCQKLGNNMFLITSQGGIRIKNNAMIKDASISAVVTGDKFIIEKGSSFQLGNYIELTDTTQDGCYFSMPNVRPVNPPEYYFGNSIQNTPGATESGNLYLYASYVDIRTFWGFFSGPEQIVHVLDCVVNGYGRVEGLSTRLRNVTFEKSHNIYGILAPKGEIEQYEDLISQKSDGISFYYNPKLVGEYLDIKNSDFRNYVNLIRMEDNDPADILKYCRFLDCKFNGNYNIARAGINTELLISYTFKPIITNYNFEVYQNTDIEISDENGDVVFVGQTDDNGKIDTLLNIIKGNYYNNTIFNIRLTKEGEFVDYRYEHDMTPWINKPIYIRDPILEPLNTPNPPVDPGNPDPGLDIIISPDATNAVYVCAHTHDEMEEMKENILTWIINNAPGELVDAPYTDRARHAYDKRPSYEEMFMNALAGNIKRIYTYDEETFGPTRKDLTIDILEMAGIEIVYTAI